MNVLNAHAISAIGLRCLYYVRGRKPLSLGYTAYKRHQIIRELKARTFSTTGLPQGYGRGLDERIVEYPWLFSRLPSSPGKLLDAGSVLNHDFLLKHPSLKCKDLTICTLAPEPNCYWDRRISYVYNDLRGTCFRNDYFDWVVCLSTLEHIGLDNSELYAPGSEPEHNPLSFVAAVREIARILRPGGTLYLSVPYGRKADHKWLQVFDSSMVQIIKREFRPRTAEEHYFLAGQEGWRVCSQHEAQGAFYYDRHRLKRLSPSLPAAAGAVACLELVK